MKRTMTTALSAFMLTAMVGCHCMRPGCGTVGGPTVVHQPATSDCAGGNCGSCQGGNCGGCGRTGCGDRRTPDLMSLVKLPFRNTYGQVGCGGFPFFWGWGCGERYWGDWSSDPHSKCETCDNHGNWTGPRSGWYGPQPREVEEEAMPEAAPEKNSDEPTPMPMPKATPMPDPDAKPMPKVDPMPSASRVRTSRRPVRTASRYGFPLRR